MNNKVNRSTSSDLVYHLDLYTYIKKINMGISSVESPRVYIRRFTCLNDIIQGLQNWGDFNGCCPVG